METLNIVLPVFLVIGVGYGLRVSRILSKEASEVLAKLVYYVASPALLFRGALHSPLSLGRDLKAISVVAATTVLVALIAYVLEIRNRPERKGVLAQGAFRANTVFVGLPIVINAFGEAAIGPAAVLIGVTVVVYNLLSIVVLVLPHPKAGNTARSIRRKLSLEILKNPLTIASMAGIGFSAVGLGLPNVVDRSFDLIGSMATPVALISVGAALDFKRLRADLTPLIRVSIIKLVVYPGCVCGGLFLAGLSGPDLHIPTLLMAAPTAVMSYVMAREMNGDEKLASAVIMGTTILSPLTISAWLAFFKFIG